MDAAQYLINRVDAELINNIGIAKSFTMGVEELNNNLGNSCRIKQKTMFSSERLDGPIVTFVSNLKKAVPNGITVDLIISRRTEVIFGTQDAYVLIQVTPSQSYATERYNSLFSEDFHNILLKRRRTELNRIIQLNPHPIYSKPMIIYNDGIYEPNDDNDYPMIKFAELGLKNLETKAQVFTFAKTILDLLNKDRNLFVLKNPVLNGYCDDFRKDFHLYIEEPYQKTDINQNNLHDW